MGARSTQRRKHVPQRTCVACRQKFDKRTLQRLVATEAGLVIDLKGKADGRGAYLCANPACWDRAIATDLLDKALRTVLTDEDRNRLRQATPER
jgi:hypothetical protein